METNRQVALDAILSAKKYRQIVPEAVERIFWEEVSRQKSAKEASKRARARLHQLSCAFMNPQTLKAAEGMLARYASGEEGALFEALRLHSSTAERLAEMEPLWARIDPAGAGLIVDLACGLNPLYLGHTGRKVRGYDISLGQVELINMWAARMGWDVAAQGADLTQPVALPACDLALMMKLLPVLEQQQKGAGMALLSSISAARKLVSFPTKTLGGRSVGMEAQYSRWFEQNLPQGEQILDRFVLAGELCYMTAPLSK